MPFPFPSGSFWNWKTLETTLPLPFPAPPNLARGSHSATAMFFAINSQKRGHFYRVLTWKRLYIAPSLLLCYSQPHPRMGSRVKTGNSVVGTAVFPPTVLKLRGAEIAVAHLGDLRGERLYDFVRVSPNRTLFGLIEVAERGKDNPIVVAAQGTFRERGRELFVGEEMNEAVAMIELCLDLNRSIINATGAVSSCPAFAGCYNEDLGTICYINAGHTPGLVRDSTGVSELAPTGLPLGLFSHVTCDARMVALQAGAALALVSGEAVFETRGKQNGSGFGAVQKSFQQARMESADEICQALLSSVPLMVEPNNANVAALVLLRQG